jgi:hypothetical protein
MKKSTNPTAPPVRGGAPRLEDGGSEVKYLERLAAFWYDVVVGDDWVATAGVVAARAGDEGERTGRVGMVAAGAGGRRTAGRRGLARRRRGRAGDSLLPRR